jgi:hypothetical protein
MRLFGLVVQRSDVRDARVEVEVEEGIMMNCGSGS